MDGNPQKGGQKENPLRVLRCVDWKLRAERWLGSAIQKKRKTHRRGVRMAESELSIEDKIRTLCFIIQSRLNIIRTQDQAGKVENKELLIEQLREIENGLLELVGDLEKIRRSGPGLSAP